ncbi:hypothetical protein [Halalkalibacter hemicellulosilyticus]|nr:hypothetical protein [Halalkalibacter hemicellulosilyticus]
MKKTKTVLLVGSILILIGLAVMTIVEGPNGTGGNNQKLPSIHGAP